MTFQIAMTQYQILFFMSGSMLLLAYMIARTVEDGKTFADVWRAIVSVLFTIGAATCFIAATVKVFG